MRTVSLCNRHGHQFAQTGGVMKIGLIGCGGMGTTHNLSLKALSGKMDVEVTALADCRQEFLERPQSSGRRQRPMSQAGSCWKMKNWMQYIYVFPAIFMQNMPF